MTEKAIATETLSVTRQIVGYQFVPPLVSDTVTGGIIRYAAGFSRVPVVGQLVFPVGQLVALPIIFPRDVVLSELSFRVITVAGAGGVSRVGIYDNNPVTFRPVNLLVDGGSQATDGSTGFKATALALALPAGLYWCVYTAGVAAATVSSFQLNVAPCLADAIFGLGNAGEQQTGWQIAFAFAALPAVFPAGATFNNGGGNGGPAIFVRLA